VPATEPDLRIGRLALGALLVAATIRIVAAVIAGFIVLGQHDELNAGRVRVGGALNTFGVAGDGVGVLLVAASVTAVWALSRHAAVSRSTIAWTRAVAIVTALMTVASAAGVLVVDDGGHIAYQLTVIIGFAVAYLVISLGGLLVLSRLRDVDVDILTLGQYLRPSDSHIALDRYVTPQEFRELYEIGMSLGFRHVESGPLVRSSYHAWEQVQAAGV